MLLDHAPLLPSLIRSEILTIATRTVSSASGWEIYL